MLFNRKELGNQELINIYKKLLLPRLIEEKMLLLLRQGKISKWFSGIGQEAIAVGCTYAMQQNEWIIPLHRNLGVFTTRNMPLSKLFMQWQGNKEGYSKGRERSFHFGSKQHFICGMISHLGPQLAIADGVALAYKLKNQNNVSLAFTGEGGTSEGDFHEALNVAAVWDLPVIFIIENNGYGLSTPVNEQYRCESLTDKAKGYGMQGVRIDGNNILEVINTIQGVREYCITQQKPYLIECNTFRMRGHEESSGTKYVPSGLFEEWAQKDPVKNFEAFLLSENVLCDQDITNLHNQYKQHIEAELQQAYKAGNIIPGTEEELNDVYAQPPTVNRQLSTYVKPSANVITSPLSTSGERQGERYQVSAEDLNQSPTDHHETPTELVKSPLSTREEGQGERYQVSAEDLNQSPTDRHETPTELVKSPLSTRGEGQGVREVRFIDAIKQALYQSMQQHDNLVLMGQDIAGYGGAFKITEGFLQAFGKKRVRNTPLCESAIVGAALGLSLEGFKSMMEMQFADFVTVGFNQIVNNLAKIYYRWGQNADVVIRMPTGGGVGAGPFHSQSNEAWFVHTPGLKVVYPSTPEDAKGLLIAAINDPGPVMYFEHKALYRSVSGMVNNEYYETEIGKARQVKQGEDISIITYGAGLHWATEYAQQHKNISIDIIDLRTLLPLDTDAIKASVARTGKVLLLHEDTLTGGIGGEISSWISEHCFELLDAPVMRCASLDTPIPFNIELEKNFLARARLHESVQKLMAY